jgi:hypothetical protein
MTTRRDQEVLASRGCSEPLQPIIFGITSLILWADTGGSTPLLTFFDIVERGCIDAHIPQFTERKNRIDKRQNQADGEPVDGEVVAPKPGFGIDLPGECEEGQSPQNTGKSSA